MKRSTMLFVLACIGALLFQPSPTQAWNPVTFNVAAEYTPSGTPYAHLAWSNGDSIDTAGFNLFKCRQPGDSCIQMNANMIPVSSDLIAGGEYSFDDLAVQPTEDYYYELEMIGLEGQIDRFGPRRVTIPAAQIARSDLLAPDPDVWETIIAVEAGAGVLLYVSWKSRAHQHT